LRERGKTKATAATFSHREKVSPKATDEGMRRENVRAAPAVAS
jgi:hypothetical protein